MSLDQFKKVTPQSMTVKRTEELMPSCWESFKPEENQTIKANISKQKKVIAPAQDLYLPADEEATKNESTKNT